MKTKKRLKPHGWWVFSAYWWNPLFWLACIFSPIFVALWAFWFHLLKAYGEIIDGLTSKWDLT